MATHAYIIAAEEKVIAGQLSEDEAGHVASAFRRECLCNEGSPDPENRDGWGTLWVNVTTRNERSGAWHDLHEALCIEFA